MNVQQLISELFERDILVTPEQAGKLTEKDAQLLSGMLDNPGAVENYLHELLVPQATATPVTPTPISSPLPLNNAILSADGTKISIVKHYAKKPKKRSYNDFVQYFNVRFATMERYLKARQELRGIMSID